jgi:hypothetical protein
VIYRGIVKGNVVQLEDEATLPEGMRVSVIPEEQIREVTIKYPMALKAWLQEARQVRAQLPKTGDSVTILRQLREECARR